MNHVVIKIQIRIRRYFGSGDRESIVSVELTERPTDGSFGQCVKTFDALLKLRIEFRGFYCSIAESDLRTIYRECVEKSIKITLRFFYALVDGGSENLYFFGRRTQGCAVGLRGSHLLISERMATHFKGEHDFTKSTTSASGRDDGCDLRRRQRRKAGWVKVWALP